MGTCRGYYGAMDSGLYTRVLTSGEVIAVSLFMILLLPLVFFIASTKSRRRLVGPSAARRPVRRSRPAPRPVEETEEEKPRGPRQRAAVVEEEPDQDADER